MSTYEASYCDTNTDLQYIEPNINNYNLRRVLPGDWILSGTTDLYYLYSAGYVTQLFKDGEEMTSVTDTPNANKEFNYNTSTGLLSFYLTSSSVTILNSAVIESGRDWYDTKVEAVRKASDLCRNVLPVPIYPRKGVGMASSTGNDYPEIIVRSTAIIACADLVRPFDKEKGDELMAMAMNPDGTGYLDMVRTGQIALSQDEGLAKHSGIIREVSINANTTGSIIDVRGKPTVDWDVIKIIISTAGTFTSGSASGVKYDTYVKDDTGLKIDKSSNAEVIDGGFQDVGHGMQVRFSPGLYTSNDEWELEISGIVDSRTMAVKFAEAERI
mgnify:FL=1|tara:strand:+ start:4553 stop:5536 length:984 start_codon:yes stop_codon:yes gene_type:complete